MKTIEIMSGDQKVQFTTKSVSFDGREFLYANMTNVIHSTERHIYTFTYDGEVKLLPYNEKDEKTLNAIFGQVQKLAAQKKAAAAAGGSKADTPKSEAPPEGEESKQDVARPDADKAEEAKAEGGKDASEKPSKSAEDAQKANGSLESSDKEAAKDASVKVTDVLGKFKTKKSFRKKDKEKAETEKGDSGKDDASKAEDKPKEDPEKVARRNKSLKTFGIILVILLVFSVAYYFISGTPSAPTPANPNSTESQQYDDIDQLIDDLQ